MNNLATPAALPENGIADDGVLILLEAARSIQGRLDDALCTVGLSGAKYAALNQLVRAREPLTLGELAERLRCVRSNVTQLVDRLEADGLVERMSCPGDRRAIRAMVTRLGAERQAAGAGAIEAVRSELASRLAPNERELLLRVLALLRQDVPHEPRQITHDQ